MVSNQYDEYYEMIESSIGEVLVDERNRQPKEGSRLYGIANYLLDAGGKLLRPYLMLMACGAVGGDPKAIMDAAIGYELGHTASLIHDDIIDGSDIRRGIESVPKKYGIKNSILAGDLLIFHSFYSLAEVSKFGIPPDRIVRALEVSSMACIDLSIGQEMEMDRSSDISLNEEDYIKIIKYKTASLMRGAAESGAILGGGTDEDIAALSKYGENIGIAFQIEDDILDFTGEKGKIKKPPGEDAKNKIITLPIIFALKDKKEIEEILNSSEEKFDRLLEIVKKTGALDKSKLVANRYVEEAKKCLATLKESNAKACLMKLADFSVTRKW